MTYQETEDFLFSQLPVFQRDGASALKHKLDNILSLTRFLDNPHQKFPSIHVAGTNGKGSSSHYLASILQEAGYKVGLYTSPHLKSFTERIKINGQEIDQNSVVEFVEKIKPQLEIKPSFFEITVAMAFDYFAKQQVDYAIIEVGLGGRFDSTNIISPLVSLITNISLDHQEYLGDTLEKIAFEKAGVIKPNTPVVVSETQEDSVTKVFKTQALQTNATLTFADQTISESNDVLTPILPALSSYQKKNVKGVLATIQQSGITITDKQCAQGILNVNKNAGLKGRWQVLQENPLTICDCGHNEAAFSFILDQIDKTEHDKLIIVLGMVNDKDHDAILSLLPSSAFYIFTEPRIPRKYSAQDLAKKAKGYSLNGEVVVDVNQAISRAQEIAKEKDLIFVGGSNFVIAEIDNL